MVDASFVADATRTPLTFGRIVVIGGGCYGSWYTQQLARAWAKGALRCDVVAVVDHNAQCRASARIASGDFGSLPVELVKAEWTEYLAEWFASGEAALEHDALVPSPLMPHLLFEWLMARAQQRWPHRNVHIRPLERPPELPWHRAAPDGRHYVSFADWMCPVNCIEPARCPATKGARDWSMPVAIQRYVQQDSVGGSLPLRGPVIFHCEHRTWGVGMIDAARVAAADLQVARWASDGAAHVLVGTMSHCHGALGVLVVE